MHHPRLAMRRRQNVLIEAIEPRLMLDATYHDLSTGKFFQSWTNTSQITTNNTWAGVPSIIGYRGDGLTGATGTDPQTIVADGSTTPTSVTANNTDPSAATSGSVYEFEIGDPTIGFVGSGTADAPHIVIHLNTTGQSDIPMSFKVRDLDGSADNATQQVAVQYRIGTSGDFTNIPGLYVADATTGPSTLGPDTVFSNFVLPAAINNQSQVQIRIMTTNAPGNDEAIGIDDLVIGDVDPMANVQFEAAQKVVNETDGTLSIVVTRSGDTTNAVDAVVSTVSGGSATVVNDYDAITSFPIHFDAGSTTATANPQLTIVNDNDLENAETVILEISNVVGGSLGVPSQMTVTIADDDSSAPGGVVLNEISIDTPTTDIPYEYIEVRGPANTVLRNVYLVQFEGTTPANAGLADYVVDLSGQQIGSNGLLVIKAATGHATPSGTTEVIDPRLAAADQLEPDSSTFALIFSPAPLTEDTDFDTNNDGTLDFGTVLPGLPTPDVFDAIGWTDNDLADGGDVVYTAAVLPHNLAASDNQGPGAVTRFPTNTTANDASAWYGGDLSGAVSTTLTYDPTGATANLPSGAVLTPGSQNYPNPNGILGFEFANYVVNEDAGTITIKVIRGSGTTGTVMVDYAVGGGGTATSPADYTGPSGSGTLTFVAGDAEEEFTITIVNDLDPEAAETINLELTSATNGAALGQSTTVITINQNDATAPAVVLNEIETDIPVLSDGPFEYIELKGPNGQSLDNVYFLSVDGDGTASGDVTYVYSFGSATIGSNGLLILKSPTGGHVVTTPGTAVVTDAALTAAVGALQNGSNSFLLVYSLSPITSGGDLDSNNDGVIDSPLTVMDAIGWKDGGASDLVYGPELTQVLGTPDGASRFVGDSTPNNAASWFNGGIVGAFQNSVFYHGDNRSFNFPTGGVLTPGAPNDLLSAQAVETAFVLTSVGFAPSLLITFANPITANAADFTVLDRNTGNPVPVTINVGTPSNQVRLNFDAFYPPDAYMRLTIAASGNTGLASSVDLDFHFLMGDITNGSPGGAPDAKVDTADFNVFAHNFGATTGRSYLQGDFDANQTVDSVDFNTFAGQYGKKLAAPTFPAAPLSGVALGGAGLFSDGEDLSGLLDVIG